MKQRLFFLKILLLVFNANIFSQDFLEVKYSINEIKNQRENFRNEKIRSVIVKDNYSEIMYDIDEDGKILSSLDQSNNIKINYNYDNETNLISIDYPVGSINFVFDIKGNVIRSDGEEIIFKYFYDENNRLIKEDGYESVIEICPFEKIIYSEFLIQEIVYPCCEGNYAERYVYEYTNNNKLNKKIHYSKDCRTNVEKASFFYEYFYDDNMNLPNKITLHSDNEKKETYITYNQYGNIFSSTENEFINFYEKFKMAVLTEDRDILESLTEWSELEGGIFSVSATSKDIFMENVYKTLFNDSWKIDIKNVELNKPILGQYGETLLSQIDPIKFGYKKNDIIFVLENHGNAIVFKKINGNFKMVSLMYTGEGD